MLATQPNAAIEPFTTAIRSERGREFLSVEAPFEARTYEFSLPTEAARDATIEEEVPVFRRATSFDGERIEVRSLPDGLQEFLVAQFGGAKFRATWISARATIEAPEEFETEPYIPARETALLPVESPAAERLSESIVPDIEPESEPATPALVADGGEPESEEPEFEVREEKFGYLSAECPSCGFEIWRSARPESQEDPENHGESGLREAMRSHLDICNEFEPIKVRATGYVFDRIGEYQADFASTRSYRVQDAMRRQKTNIVCISPEEALAVCKEFVCYDSDQRTWMNGMQDKALARVRREIIEEMERQGYRYEDSSRFGLAAEFVPPEEQESGSESGSDESEGDASENSGESEEPDNGPESEPLTDGGEELPKTLRDNLEASGNRSPEEIAELSSGCTGCGEEFPVGELYWFNRQTFRCPGCHPEVPSGGEIIEADDDAEILPDGGSVEPEEQRIRCPNDGALLELQNGGDTRCPECGYLGTATPREREMIARQEAYNEVREVYSALIHRHQSLKEQVEEHIDTAELDAAGHQQLGQRQGRRDEAIRSVRKLETLLNDWVERFEEVEG